MDRLLGNTDTLSTLPDTAGRIGDLLECQRPDIDELLEIFNVDPTLTAKTLKIANRVFSPRSSRIDCISHAFKVIGDEVVYELASSHRELNEQSAQNIACIDLERFWRQSLDTGLIAQELAKELDVPHYKRFYVAGLLLNLGELVCAEQQPELAAKASIDNVSTTTLPWIKQKEIFNYTYADLSRELMKRWNIPLSISEVIGFVHQSGDSDLGKSAKILYVALLASLSIGDNRFPLQSTVTGFDLKAIGASREQLEIAMESANMEAFYAMSAMDPLSMVIL